MSLRQEVTDLLRALVRLDTVNPPGNEIRAAALLRDYFADSGIPSCPRVMPIVRASSRGSRATAGRRSCF
jgi:acetylornithine deacetylase/succinyl-diaminopimelate desuccinylase-like protein